MYKSGDLVQYCADGSLAFIERKNGQAKIRGQRVDLGEVEHRVHGCIPKATEVVAEVVLPCGEHARSALVVFLQANVDLMETFQCRTADTVEIVRIPAEVEDELARYLPSYMVPTAFLLMGELPRTATGKMHRSRLREIGSNFSVQQLAESRTTVESLKQQPTSEAERCMQAIWAGVLSIDASSIGLDDSFFHLGGDSIAAMRVVAECRKMGLFVALADLFRQRQLKRVAATAIPLAEAAVREIPTRQHSGPIPLSPYQKYIWLAEQRCDGSISYLKPLSIRLRGPLDLAALKRALLALEERHDTLRTIFMVNETGSMQQTVRPFEPKMLSVVDISSEVDPDRRLRDELRIDAKTPFRLQSEAGWRTCVYRCSKYDHVLSIVLHNIIADGWSLGILSRELATLYSAAVHKQDPLSQLEPLPIQHGDYCVWKRQEAETARYQQQLKYWLDCLGGSHSAVPAYDKPRPAVPSGQADIVEFGITSDLYGRIRQFCNENEVTTSTVMLSALAATHHRLSRTSDARIWIAFASRDRSELRGLIGPIVNLCCIVTNAGSGETFASLVQQIRTSTMSAFANQDVQFTEIASRLQGDEGTHQEQFVNTVFEFNNSQDLPGFQLAGVKSQVLPTMPSTRVDLEFMVNQTEDALEGQIFFSTDVYLRQTITNMLRVFYEVLDKGLDNAGQSLLALQ